MKIGVNWLKEYIDDGLSISELSDKLTMAGIEVESVKEVMDGAETVLELSITPNRSDCLSFLGIAREVSALTGKPVKFPKKGIVRQQTDAAAKAFITITLSESNLCPRYCTKIVKGVTIAPSPEWLKNRLLSIGMKPINNVVDITNFVMMEMGHPLHAFDYKGIEGKEIIVRMAQNQERFVALDGREYLLSPDMLVISDVKKPIALAGVIGGANSEVGITTEDLLLEAAFFDPISIRKTAKKLGIHTESSHRFERGVDYRCVPRALERAAALIQEVAGGEASADILDTYPKPLTSPVLSLRLARVKKVLGIEIDFKEIEQYMKRLSFNPVTVTDDAGTPLSLTITVPSFRCDILREIDLIEEVIRLHGYDTLPAKNPVSTFTKPLKREEGKIINQIKEVFSTKGFCEVITFSFVSDSLWQDLNLLKDEDTDSRSIRIKNSLSSEWNIMRTTLLPGLLSTISTNRKKGNEDIQIFELGKVFFTDREETMLACAISAQRENNLWRKKNDSRTFFDLKGMLEILMQKLRITNYQLKKTVHPLLKKHCCAAIYFEGKEVGVIGAIADNISKKFDSDEQILVLQICLNPFFAQEGEKRFFSPLPRYPTMIRDAALIVDKTIKSDEIYTTIMQERSSILQEARLFDCYEGKPVPDGKKSVAYSLVYRADDRTLTDKEVDDTHEKIINRLKGTLGGTFRD